MVGNDSTRLVAGNDIFSNNPPLQIGVSISNLANIVFVVYISLKIDKRDMSRLYTLWLYFVHAPSDVIQLVISILQLRGIVDSSGKYYRDYIDLVQVSGKFFLDLASHVYRILAMLMLAATFMSYKFPLTFVRVFHPTRRNKLYLSGFVFVVLQVTDSNLHTVLVVRYGPLASPYTEIWYALIITISAASTFLLILFYILSLFVICRYACRKQNRADSSVIHRRQLLSVIVYATFPNIIVFVGQLMNVFQAIVAGIPNNEKSDDHPIIVVSAVFNKINRYGNYLRIPILTVSTFVAFHSYRRILLSMLPFRSSVVQVKAVGYSMRSSQTFSQSYM